LNTARHEWIVVGDSEGGAAGLCLALERFPIAWTIACNAGYRHFGDTIPNCYLLYAPEPRREHWEHALEMRKQGAWLVTCNCRPMLLMGIDPFDEVFRVRGVSRLPGVFVRGQYTDAGLSGLMCLQYAINNGATKVALVGMEGYSDDHGVFCAWQTKSFIRPFTQHVVDQCPDVQFVLYGTMNYEITGANVEHVPCGEQQEVACFDPFSVTAKQQTEEEMKSVVRQIVRGQAEQE